MKRIQFSGFYKQILLFVLLLFGLVSDGVYGWKNTSILSANRISGFVYDERRRLLADVFVELQNDQYSSINRTKTDDSGRYVFSGMPLGNYYVHVIPTRGDLEEQTIRIEVNSLAFSTLNTGGNEDVIQDFHLKLRKNNEKSFYEKGVVFAQEVPQKAQALYEKSIESINQQNKAEAIRKLQQAIEEFPNYFLALTRLGYIYFEDNKFDLASVLFAKAADVNPKSEPTIYLLAMSVFQLKKYETAITFLNGAIDLQHHTARIYLLLGKSLKMVKKYQDAERSLKKAEKLEPKNADIHWELALIYGNYLNKFKEAANHLEIFLELQPDSKDSENIIKLIAKFKKKSS